MNDIEMIQKEIDELEFELCHEMGLLTRKHMETRIKELRKKLQLLNKK